MKGSNEYQPEFDGLRTVAILPVVLFHAEVPGLRGGFVGVDVFFVLSGFLITRLLVRELLRTGTLHLTAFYARRLRRLLPALATVTATTLFLGALILSPALEQQSLARSAIATMAFVSNFYFWRVQAIYFAPPSDWIPLLHMWTLSVEEQLYLVWPGLLVMATQFGWRSERARGGGPLLLMLALFTISFALFFWGAYARQTAAFYLTPTRVWEFVLGAALAIAGDNLKRMHAAGGIVAILGLGAIVVAVMMLHSFFLSVTAAAFGTAAIIAGIESKPTASCARLLQLGPMVIVGRLSYSWYLWHWPLLAYSRILDPGNDSLVRALAAVLCAFVLASLTFVFVENPIRRNHPWPFNTVRESFVAGGMISLVVIGVAMALLFRANVLVRGDPWLKAIMQASHGVAAIPGCTFAQTFSHLAPAVRCANGDGDAPVRILVWGDSQAQQLMPMMQMAGEAGHYGVATWSMSSCPTVVLGLVVQRGLATACRDFNRAIADQLSGLSAAGLKGIVLATRNFGFPDASDQLSAWSSGMREVLSLATTHDLRVLLIAPIPVFSLMLPECLAHAPPERCGASRTALERERSPLISALSEIAASRTTVRIWDAFDAICGETDCTPMRDGLIMYSDRGHLSVRGAQALLAAATPNLNWLRGVK